MTDLIINPSEPNVPIPLGAGPVVLRAGDHSVEGTSTIELRWLPRPRVEVVATFDDAGPIWQMEHDSPGQSTLTLEFPTLGFSSPILIRNTSLGSTAAITGSFQGFALPAVTQSCERIEFYLANLPDLYANVPSDGGPQRFKRVLTLEDRQWTVEIAPTPRINELEKALSHSGGYALTHRAVVKRVDGSSVERDEAVELLDVLGDLLSFAFGFRVSALLARGVSGEVVVWQERQLRTIDQWRTRYAWLDRHHAESLEAVFGGFLALASDPIWCKPLRSAVYWFTHANNSSIGADTGIVLAQSALELLSWTWLVQDRRSISADGFDKLPAADRIRLALSGAEIPLAIPPELDELQQVAKAFNWPDGPSALTALRNSIVHPNLDKRFKYADAMIDVWLLSQWYVEMLLLRRIGFNGFYGSRLRQRWTGQVELVPWAI